MTIESTLKRLGPTFYGSNDQQCREIAEDWMTTFSADQAEDWIAAGFWCPSTARLVAALGITAGEVAAICNDNITGSDDAVRDLCNGDIPVDALTE